MKKALILLTALAFTLSLVYGSSLFKTFIPPFSEGTCIGFKIDGIDMSEPVLDQNLIDALAVVDKNHMMSSTVLILIQTGAYSYQAFSEEVTFSDLRKINAKEIPCND